MLKCAVAADVVGLPNRHSPETVGHLARASQRAPLAVTRDMRSGSTTAACQEVARFKRLDLARKNHSWDAVLSCRRGARELMNRLANAAGGCSLSRRRVLPDAVVYRLQSAAGDPMMPMLLPSFGSATIYARAGRPLR